MQNVAQGAVADNQKQDQVNGQHGVIKSSTPQSNISSPTKSETETFSEQPRFMSDSSESEEDSVSEVESFVLDQAELDDEPRLENSTFLLSATEEAERNVDPETQARLEALLEAAGIGKLSSGDGKHLADPDVLRRLTSSVSCALDEAAAALTRMRTDNPRSSIITEKTVLDNARSLVEACSDGDVGTVRKLLTEGRSVHETTEEGESLLSLACSAGYFELAQVLLAMHANVEDRGIKGDCTPLMEAASAGHVDIVRLLIAHGADVNAQSSSGNTPLMYGCAGGHEEVVRVLLEAGSNVEDHNENGHTPLMEAASAGHVGVSKILLEFGAGINTHSNEFKESALTLACYKGHLNMVRFLLDAGADQEHKTDEMHTALMEASMDGHVEVARLLLDSGAQVNMPTDSFESPLTLAACGGHVDLAMLLIERGANIEEVNDEGYTPLMEAAREGHEEMVALLLSQGANINAQTEETQETALTLACCGGFLEVADFLIKAGADLELGASTPLMEASQEGHIDLVRFLLESNADVHAQTQTGDTALTYACENGHTDVANILLQYGADLEHESEGGRTPLMKACRAGHLCTVQFLLQKNANVNRQTTNNDHTPLSLACAGGHLAVVELLLSQSADPFHKLKDNSTMLIEAAKGGHTSVVQLLLDYPHSIMMTPNHGAAGHSVPTSQSTPIPADATVSSTADLYSGLHEVPDAVRAMATQQDDSNTNDGGITGLNAPSMRLSDSSQTLTTTAHQQNQQQVPQQQQTSLVGKQKSLMRKNRLSSGITFDNNLTSAEAQQVRTQPIGESSSTPPSGPTNNTTTNTTTTTSEVIELLCDEDNSILDKGSTGTPAAFISSTTSPASLTSPTTASSATSSSTSATCTTVVSNVPPTTGSVMEFIKARKQQQQHSREEQILQKQQILEELQRVERQLQVKAPNHLLLKTYGMTLDPIQQSTSATNTNNGGTSTTSLIPGVLNIDLASQNVASNTQGLVCGTGGMSGTLFHQGANNIVHNAFYTGKPNASGASGTVAAQSFVSPVTPLQPLSSVTVSSGVNTDQTSAVSYLVPYATSNQQTLTAAAAAVTATQQQTTQQQQPQPQPLCATSSEVNQNTAISDRPKAKPVSKKDSKNQRKQQQAAAQQQAAQAQQQQQQQAQAQQQQQQNVATNLTTTIQTNTNYPTTLQQLQNNQQQTAVAMIQQHLQKHHQQAPTLVGNNGGNSGSTNQIQSQTANTILSHMQLLQQHTPQQVHQVLQQTGEQLRSIGGGATPTTTVGDDLVNMLSEQHRQLFEDSEKLKQDVAIRDLDTTVDDVVQTLETFSLDDVTNVTSVDQDKLQVAQQAAALRGQTFDTNQIVLEQAMSAMAAVHSQQGQNVVVCNQQLQIQHQPTVVNTSQADVTRVEYFAVPTSVAPVPGLAVQHATGLQFQYQQYQLTTGLQVATSGGNMQLQGNTTSTTPGGIDMTSGLQIGAASTAPQIQRMQRFNTSAQYQAGFQAGIQRYLESQLGACPAQCQTLPTSSDNTNLSVTSVQQPQQPGQQQQQQQPISATATGQYVQPSCTAHQVQVATQTPQPQPPNVPAVISEKKSSKNEGGKSKKRFQMVSRHASNVPPSQRQDNGQFPNSQSYQVDPNTAGVTQQYTPTQTYNPASGITQTPQTAFSCMDVDSETDSNHDTALTLACAGGHEELVELLLSRGADIEHRDKKGFTPLILAATAGHEKVVEILLNHGADLEAQSERTKDTPLSLACSGGRYEVVELLLSRGSNKEHRNVSDYTPLSLAASGGYVNIIKLLLTQGAEINSRTGSKLGISPLMLAAMNGHTAAVKMLLDMGSDINAQIETNRNTALTLACFQGRHEVVSLLLDRKANVEHRAKTGLTPLMEAASGGYVDVGRVLLDKGADVNATPVPSSRDTALTIAADKGHCRFVELLLSRGAAVEVKNKKGNSPLWLAANGGHLNVVELLYNANADIDSQDNRKVSCLMAAFRKGHIKVVKWMVGHVTQFPSDQEMMRYISTVSDKELLEKCQECVKVIRAAKETQAAKANKNATILLEELDMEKNREESKKAAAARRRERKKKKKLEKKEEKRKLHEENKKNETYDDNKDKKNTTNVVVPDDTTDKADAEEASGENTPTESPVRNGEADKEEGDSGIDANSQGSCSSNDVKAKEKRKEKKKKKIEKITNKTENVHHTTTTHEQHSNNHHTHNHSPQQSRGSATTNNASTSKSHSVESKEHKTEKQQRHSSEQTPATPSTVHHPTTEVTPNNKSGNASNRSSGGQSNRKGLLVFEASRHPCDREDFEATGNENYAPVVKGKKLYIHYENENMPPVVNQKGTATSPKQANKREEGWKEVVRKSSIQAVSTFESGTKKVSVPLNAISRVIGRGGSNINAIRGATGAHIEVEKQSKGQGERNITIKGSAEATRQAHNLIATLIKDPEADILQIIPKTTKLVGTISAWDKTSTSLSMKAKTNQKISNVSNVSSISSTAMTQNKPPGSASIAPIIPSMRSNSTVKMGTSFPPPVSRATAPRLVAAAEKRAAAAQMAGIGTKNTMSYTTAMMAAGRGSTKVVTSASGQTFAAKLTETSAQQHTVPTSQLNSIKTKVSQSLGMSQAIISTPVSPQTSSTIQQSQQSATHTNSSNVNVIVASPKHRPPSTASAPPTMTQHSCNKIPFSASTIRSEHQPTIVSSNLNQTGNGNVGNGPQQQTDNMVSNSTQHMVGSSGGISVNNTTNTAANNIQLLSQQLHHQQSNVVTQQIQPIHMESNLNTQSNVVTTSSSSVSSIVQQAPPPNRVQTYSLFDTFSKHQQTMWGGARNNDTNEKPINFAAATGSVGSQSNITPKFIDNDQPQVDASKAPGYRGTAVCSPVSSKTSSNSTTPPNLPTNFQNYSDPSCIGKPPAAMVAQGLAVTRPLSRTPGMDVGLDLSPQQYNRNLYQPNIPPPQHLDPSGGLFKPPVSSGYGPSENLLKIVPGDNQQNLIQSFHHQPQQQQPLPHHIGYSQPQQCTSSSNSTVTMSRLNPRAPDFSSSLHNLSNKQHSSHSSQQPAPPVVNTNMFNSSGGYHHPGLSAPQQQQHNTMLNNTNVPPYQLKSSIGGYPQTSTGPPPPRPNQNSQQQQRWPFIQHASNTSGGFQPADMMCLPNMNHITNLSQSDYLSVLENGGGMNIVNSSPSMSPNSPSDSQQRGVGGGNTGNGGMSEDRKIPRPIGTERAWKNNPYNNPQIPQQQSTAATINQLGAEIGEATSIWLLNNEAKITLNSWPNIASNMDRHNLFRTYPYNRLPTDDMPTMDTTFSHMDSQQQAAFQNGSTATALSLMHSLQQYNATAAGNTGVVGAVGPEMVDTSNAGSWGDVTITGDKQQQQQQATHGWTTTTPHKWSNQ
ncbi:ankyrin repeat and KH domain-containing protein 1 isoform X4 [Chrysoperla carnea]|uniref:ankyrin repeat and KH domain-containing protein 1 isoform X4 n=1 Tax=Chrysoperla carnea TaxID=189513 RepID=UPI001D07FED9|nr:ankyrin repeat and KH domain-containing protein 1 isoform X4 [Chrysoperla carnea]